VAAGAAALLVLARLPAAPPVQVADRAAEVSDEDFVLAIAGGSADDFESTLPADYQAIASLLEPQ
jgi:hypothetical protein